MNHRNQKTYYSKDPRLCSSGCCCLLNGSNWCRYCEINEANTDLGALLHLLHHSLVLLSDGQRGRVDPLVDHLPFARLEREQTFSCVTHPAPGTNTQTDRCVAERADVKCRHA